jgi:hypothetical protein
VRVEEAPIGHAGARAAGPTPNKNTANGGRPRVTPEPAIDSVPAMHVPEEILPHSKRKLSGSEDAAMKMSNSFSELSSLLRGVQVRMEDQGGRLDTMGHDLSKLPATAEAQLDVLKVLVTQLEKQNTMNATMVETFAGLPSVMKGVQESLAKTAATDARTAQTLDDFKSTMNRIHTSMGEMVDTTKVQADAAQSLAKNHSTTVARMESSTQEGLKALRWAQEDQANRMAKMVGENSRWNRAILVLMILSFAALVSIFGALLSA